MKLKTSRGFCLTWPGRIPLKEWSRREQRESEKTTWKVHACPTPAPSSLCSAQLHGKLALPFYFPLVAMQYACFQHRLFHVPRRHYAQFLCLSYKQAIPFTLIQELAAFVNILEIVKNVGCCNESYHYHRLTEFGQV